MPTGRDLVASSTVTRRRVEGLIDSNNGLRRMKKLSQSTKLLYNPASDVSYTTFIRYHIARNNSTMPKNPSSPAKPHGRPFSTSTSIDDLKCPMEGCTYGTPSKIHLANHIRVHTGEEPYECDHSECQYRAKSDSALRHHKIKNHGFVPRPYKKTAKAGGKESDPLFSDEEIES